MCDCFHLAFPIWHGSPGTGAARRLKGPESGAGDDSICEEPQELIEGERPRPQGSSPVNEYPANEKYSDKQAEQEIYDPYHKSGSTKKGKWVGFGSFFEKRSFARMSQTEDIEDTESGVFVRTVKEAGVEGLIVRGGGKAGIFVQEVKPESPASKHLSVKEGDQILSATLYFDNVSYEDALEILGHAQTCKMELCLKRKTPSASSTLERSTDMQPEFASGEEEASPAVRGRPKTQRRQEARISWPKFPSLTRGRKAYFKRSHSTSEAEEEKLELSPTTSDTESPVKSQKVVKDKTKMQKVKVSKVKTSLRSKSADQSERLVVEPTPEFVEFIEKQEALQKTSDSLGPQGAMLTETLVVDETVRKAAGRMRNECTFPSGSGTEAEPGRHKSELISLDKTLKTTDITDSLVDQKCHSAKHSPDGKKRKKKQRSELRVNIQGKEKEELSPDSLLMSPQPLPTHTSPKAIKIPDTETRTQDFSVVLESTVSPRVISHAEMREHQMAIDINSQRVNISQPAPKVDKKIEGEQLNLDGNLIKADTSFDISDISTSKRYQKTDSGKQWKERSILISDLKRYGIRSRSPTADISLARAHFGVPATKVDSSPLKPITSSSEHGLLEKMSDKTPKIPSTTSLLTEEALEKTSFRKDSGSSTIPDVGIKDPLLKLGDSELPVETKTNGLKGELDAVISPKFKLPKKDITDLDIHETMLQKTKQEHPIEKIEKKINLPKREDIEIPGMEATASKASAPVPGVKMTVDIQMQTINVDNIKEVSSKTDQPTVKLPKVDLPDLDTHPQITKTDVTAEKVNLNITPAISKSKTSHMTGMSEDASIIGPQSVTQTDLNEGKIKVFEQSDTSYSIAELSKRSLPTFKLPKTQLADADSHQPITMTQLEHSKLKAEMIGLKPETFLLKEKDGADLGMEPEIRIKLPNREDFEIPGSEGSVALANNNQLPGIKPSQTGDVTAAQTSAIETQKVHAVISSDTTKDTTSKLRCSTMKLPNVEFSEPDSHQQITKVDVDAEKKIDMKKDSTAVQELISQSKIFKIPKIQDDEMSFSIQKTEVNVKKPRKELPKDITIKTSAEAMIEVDRKIPIDTSAIQPVDIDLKGECGGVKTLEGQLKMQKLAISVKQEKVKSDINLSFPTKKTPEKDIKKAQTDKEFSTSRPESPSLEATGELPDIERGGRAKFQMPSIKMPSIGISKPEIKGPKLSGDFTLPSVGVSLEKPGGGIEVPKVSAGSSVDVELPEAQLDVSGKKPSIDIQGSSVDVEGPDLEVGTGVDLEGQGSRFRMPKFGMSLPKMKGPEVDLSISKPQVDVSVPEAKVKAQLPGGDVEVPPVEGQVEIPESDIKGPEFKLKKPKISFPKFGFSKDVKTPEVDVGLSKGEVTMPEASVEIRGPEVDIKSPEIDGKIEAEVGGSPSKFKLPTIKMPKFGTSASKGKVELTGVQADVKAPEMEVQPGKVEVEVPKVTKPEIDISVSKPELEIKSPSLEATGELPDIERGGRAKFQMPSIKMPSIGISKPEIKGPKLSGDFTLPSVGVSLEKPGGGIEVPKVSAGSSVDVELPEAQLDVSGKKPSIDIQGSSVDVEGPDLEVGTGVDLEGQGSRFRMPKFGMSLPKMKGPEVDLSISKPQVDVSVPEAKVKAQLPGGDVEVPPVEGQVEIPESDIKGPEFKLKKPKISFPKFGFSKDVKTPEVDVGLSKGEVTMPEASVEIRGPEVDIKSPEIDGKIEAEVGGSPSKFKLPTIKMPKFGTSASKGKVELTGVQADVKAPEMEVQPGKVEVEVPKVTKPEIDISVSKPELEIKSPSLEATGELPDIERGGRAKFQMPSIKMPSIGISKPEIKGPKLSGDFTLPSVGVSLEKPGGGIEVPKVSAGSSVDVELPEAQLDVSGKKPSIDIQGSSVDVEGPDLEVGTGVDLEGQGSRFRMPKFGMSLPKMKGPEVDLSISKPQVDVSVPEAKVKAQLPGGDVEVPPVEGQVEIPESDIKGPEFKLKKPKISFPKFGFSKDVKTPEVDVGLSKGEVTMPEASVEIRGPEVDIKSPEIDGKIEAEVGGSPSKFKLPTIKMPKFGTSASKGKVELTGVQADVKAPEMEVQPGKVEVEVPKVTKPEIDISVSKPELEIKSPSLEATGELPDIERGGRAKFQMPSIKMPSIGISKPEIKGPKLSGDFTLPSVGVSLEKPGGGIEVPKVSAGSSVDVELPEAQLDVSGKKPSIDIQGSSVDVEGPDLEVGTGVDLEGQGSRFRMPKFGMSLPKMKGPEVDLSISKPQVDVSVPEAKVKAQLPGGDVEVPPVEGQVEIPESDIKGPEFKLKKPKISFPKFGFSKDVKTPEVDVGLSKGEVTMPEASVEIRGPEVDIKSPEIDGKIEAEVGGSPSKFKLPTIKMPKFGTSASKGKVELTGVQADVKAPEMEVQPGKVEVEVPKVTKPEIDISVSKPELEIKSPSLEATGELPDIERGGRAKFQMPSIKMPSIGISKPEIKGPKLSGDFTLPSVGVSLEKPGGGIEVPKVSAGSSVDVELPEAQLDVSGKKPSIDIQGSSVDVEGPDLEVGTGVDLEGQGSRFRMPKFGMSLPKMKGPEVDLSISKPQVDVSVPEAKVKAQLPGGDVEVPPVEGQVEIPESDIKGPEFKLKKPKISFPKFGFSKDVKTPEVDVGLSKGEVTMPEASVEIRGPEVDIKSPEIDGKIEAEVGGSPSKFKLPTIKMPKFGTSASKGKVELTGVQADVKAPEMEVQPGKVEVEVPKVTKPEIDISVSKPELEIKSPSLEATGELPDIERGGRAKFQMPSIKMPSIGISKPEIKGPKLSGDFTLPSVGVSLEKPGGGIEVPKVSAGSSVDVELPEAQLDVSGKKPSIDIQGSSVDVEGPDLEVGTGVDLEGQGSRFRMPKFGMSLPKMKGPEVDLSISKPQVDVSVPEAKVKAQLPGGDVEVPPVEGQVEIPESDIKGPEFKLKKPKISFPKFGFSKDVKTPEVDVGLSKGEVTMPEASVEIRGPEVDIKSPEIDGKIEAEVGGSPSKFKLPTIKMPKFGTSASKGKVELTGVQADVKAPEMEVQPGKVEVEVPKVTKPEIDISVSKPELEIKSPSLEATGELPDIERGGRAKFQMPSIKMPSIGISKPEIKGPKLSGDFTLPSVGVSLEKPGGGIEVPKVSAGSSVDVELPEAQLDVSGKKPSIDIQGSSVDVEGPDLEVGTGVDLEGQGSRFRMPKFGMSLPKMKGPEVDLSISKPQVDVSVPEAKVKAQLPGGDVEVPPVEGQVEIPESDIKGPEFKLKKPKISFPKFGFSKDVKTPEVDVGLSKGEVTMPEASVEIRGPEVDIKSPEIDGKIEAEVGGSPSKFKLPTIKMPKFGTSASKGKVELTGVQADVKAPEMEVQPGKVEVEVPKVTKPEIDISVSKPELEIKSPSLEATGELPDIERGGRAKFQMPSIKMPSIGISKPEIKGPKLSGDFTLPSVGVSLEKPGGGIEVPKVSAGSSVDVELPEAQLDVSGKKPSIDIQGSSVDVEGPDLEVGTGVDLEGQGSRFRMPKFGMSLPKMKGPEVDLSISKPQVDVSVPEAKVKAQLPGGDVEVPPVEGQVEIPESDIKGPEFKLKKPKISFPKFGFSKDVKTPEVDVGLSKGEVTMPEASVEIRGPEVDIKSPEIDGKIEAEVGGSPSKFKLPTIKMPKFGTSASKGKVELTGVQADVKAPEMEVQPGKVEVEVPKVTKPEIDISVSKPELEIKSPSLEATGELPDIERGGRAKFQMPSIKMPSIGISKPEIKGPKLSGDFTLPSVGVSLEKPGGGIEVPKVSAGSSVDVELPEAQLDVSGKKPSIDIQGSSVDVEGPDLEVGTGVDLEGQGSRFRMPKFGMSLPKMKGPEVDLSISKPQVDVSVPEAKVKAQLPGGDVEVPPVEGQVEIPESDIKGPEFKLKKPKISFPKFGFSKDVKTPEVDVGLSKGEVTMPEASVEIRGPEVDIKSPEIDGKIEAEVGGSPSKFKLPTIKMPKFGTSASKGKVELTGVQADVKAPEMEVQPGKVEVEVPKVTKPEIDISVSKPELEIKSPSLEATGELPDIERGGRAKFQMPSIKMPSIGISKPEIKGPKLSGDFTLPSVGVSLEKPGGGIEVPKVSAGSSVDVELPEAQLDVSGKKPSIDIQGSSVDVEGPDLEVGTGVDLEGQGSRFRMPKFGMSLPKMKGPEVDLSISKPQVDVSVPEAKVKAQLPGGDVEVPPVEGQVEIPESDIKGPEFKLKKPKISFPKFGFSKDVKTPEVDVGLSKGEVTMPEASVEIRGPEVDIKSPEIDGKIEAEVGGSPSKFKLPTIKMPKFGTSASKGKVELTGVQADVKAPEMEVQPGKVEVEVPKVTKPEIDISVSKPELEIKSPSLEATGELPDIERGGRAKFQMPSIKMPSIGISKPEIKGPKLSGDFTLPSVGVSLEKPGGGIEVPKVSAGSSVDVELPEAQLDVSGKKPSIDIQGSSVDVEGPDLEVGTGVDLEGQGSRFRMPKFGMSLPKMKGPEVDLSISKPQVDVSVPEAKVKAQLPGGDVEVPPVEGQVEIPESDIKGPEFKLKKPKISFPKFGFSKDVKTPEVDVGLSKGEVTMPEASVEIRGPEVDIKSPEIDGKIEAEVGGSPSKFKLPTIKMPKFGTSASKGKVELTGVQADVKAPEMEVQPGKVEVEVPKVTKPEIDISVSKPELEIKSPSLEATGELPDIERGGRAKFQMPSIKMPSIGISKPEIKGPKLSGEESVEIRAPEVDVVSPQTDSKADADTGGSPSKFKLPTIKLPKFGISTAKEKSTDQDTGIIETDTKTAGVTFEGSALKVEKQIKKTLDVSKKISDVNISFPKVNTEDINATRCGDEKYLVEQPSIALKGEGADVSSEKAGMHTNVKEPVKSSRFNLPSLGDVFRGFELEFNVPTLDEVEKSLSPSKEEIEGSLMEQQEPTVLNTEKELSHVQTSSPAEVAADAPSFTKETEVKDKSKFKFWFPKIGFAESSEKSKSMSLNVAAEKTVVSPDPQEKKEDEDSKETEAKTEKGSWFKFPKFGTTSPSKTAKESENVTSLSQENLGKTIDVDAAEDLSPTLSVRSSDAFADISSTVTSEQVGLSEASPTKVMVKYSEPAVIVGVGEVKVPSDVITSTTKTELIHLEPNLPEKFDTDTIPITVGGTSSLERILREDTGDVHVITSNIQTLPDTEHTTIITTLETHSVPHDSLKKTVKMATVPWTVEAPIESFSTTSSEHITVERRVVKEKSGDEKGTVIITQKVTHTDSGEPVPEDAASAIRKLKDTMHSEKLRFFEGDETLRVTVSSHGVETQMFESSTESK